MKVVTAREELERTRAEATGTVGVVMTMGALHEGHASLLRTARAKAGTVLMTIFVNPLQFGPHEDFDRYPRTLVKDLEIAQSEGVDVVFAPSREVMYPLGEPAVRVSPGPLGQILEGASRPGFFDGVLTIVLKLLNLTRADLAFFGEKDFQQLVIVRGVARDLALGVEVEGVPTVRDPDGLALSSRNRFLSAAERAQATSLYAGLRAAGRLHAAGERDAARLCAGARSAFAVEPDYLELRRRDDLGTYDPSHPAILLVAAVVGTTRLIDNLSLEDT
jgi:pantoate--beta-alanine ligase